MECVRKRERERGLLPITWEWRLPLIIWSNYINIKCSSFGYDRCGCCKTRASKTEKCQDVRNVWKIGILPPDSVWATFEETFWKIRRTLTLLNLSTHLSADHKPNTNDLLPLFQTVFFFSLLRLGRYGFQLIFFWRPSNPKTAELSLANSGHVLQLRLVDNLFAKKALSCRLKTLLLTVGTAAKKNRLLSISFWYGFTSQRWPHLDTRSIHSSRGKVCEQKKTAGAMYWWRFLFLHQIRSPTWLTHSGLEIRALFSLFIHFERIHRWIKRSVAYPFTNPPGQSIFSSDNPSDIHLVTSDF